MSSEWGCFVVLTTDGSKELEIYLQQDARETDPCIMIGQRPTGEPRLKLLPAEALHLGQGLIRLVTMATSDKVPIRCEPCDDHGV